MIVHWAKSMCFFHSIFCMCHRRLLQNRRVWDGVKHRNENEHSSSWNPWHWEKGQIKHTQMEEKPSNLII